MTTTTPTRPWWREPMAALRQEPFGALAYDFADRRLAFLRRPASPPLLQQFEQGLNAPIFLTWELTYACNLECAHCLSSSGRRDPRELTTAQCEAVIDELQRMQVFYVNIGGGEPTIRPDFWHLLEYAVAHDVGVKFSTNGSQITGQRAAFLAGTDYVDVQVSLDGATAEVNDHLRGTGSFVTAITALRHLKDAGFRDAKISVVCTRHNIGQLDAFKALADEYAATLRLTRLRPSGRGADVWDDLHPLPEQQRELYDWLLAHGENVLTGDSFFHLAAYGEALPGLNLCGAGRVVCLIDPIGDVYACPFAIHDTFRAGNLLTDGGFEKVWQDSTLFHELRSPQTDGACASCQFFDSCRGGCMAAKFFTGLPLDGPDPECVQGYGEQALARDRVVPEPSQDHSRSAPGRNQPVMLRSQSTTVMGQGISLPVVISPTGLQAVHPDGEVAVARAAAARGTVAFVDCDVQVRAPDLIALTRHFADPSVALVGPRVAAVSHSTSPRWFERYDAASPSLALGRTPCSVRPGAAAAWLPSACLVARTASLGDGFAANLRVGEDVDLVWRMVAAGHVVRYDPSVEARHETRSTVRDWLGRKAYYGSGGAELAVRHGDLLAPAVLTPAYALAAAGCCSVAAGPCPWRRWPCSTGPTPSGRPSRRPLPAASRCVASCGQCVRSPRSPFDTGGRPRRWPRSARVTRDAPSSPHSPSTSLPPSTSTAITTTGSTR